MILCIVHLLLVVTCYPSLIYADIDDPDYDRSTTQLIRSRGFESQTHFVKTKDNYILTMYRIVNPFNANPAPNPVLLQHGLISSGADWILASPGTFARPPRDPRNYRAHSIGNNLGFELSNFGYDVWLGNVRGNWDSTNHTRLKPWQDTKYWEFSLDQIAAYDLPASIQYIKKLTLKYSVGVVAHSTNSAAMFALLATRPIYNKIVKPFIALSPCSRVKHAETSLIKYIGDLPFAESIVTSFGGPFPPQSSLQGFALNSLCQNHIKIICQNILHLTTSFFGEGMNQTRFHVYLNHFPQSTSAQNLVHFVQLYKSGRFRRYDFGGAENNEKYGQEIPPDYRLDRITSRNIALIYSKGDLINTYPDVQWLVKKLKVPLLENYLTPKSFTHYGLIWGTSAGKWVNSKIVDVLARSDRNDYRYN